MSIGPTVECGACGSIQARKAGRRNCIKCGAALPVLAIEGKPVTPSTDEEKAYDANERRKHAKIKPRSTYIDDNGNERENFTASTMKKDDGK